MKFSYTLLKYYLPKLGAKASVIDALSMYSFEAEEAEGKTIEISLPPNRYSDAGSHLGVVRELSAIFDMAVKDAPKLVAAKAVTAPKMFSVKIEDKALCPRYSAQYFDNVKIGPSPTWMQEVLIECGMRPINNVVDVMNYVMLETGQPLHAFDYDKLLVQGKAKLVVRHAKLNETIVSIDGVKYTLSPEMLVIADETKPLVIAGVKGGTGCEVTEATKRIIVEAANFDFVSILKTSRKLGLVTDASSRFSHNLSPVLVAHGIARAAEFLKDLASAKAGERYDSQTKPDAKHFVKFDVQKFNALIGVTFTASQAAGYLKKLGFKSAKGDLWEVPPTRGDIETQEDLSEEVARMYGYQNIKPIPPLAHLVPPEKNEYVALSALLRGMLAGFEFDEVYTHSFVAKEDVALGNPWTGEALSLQNPTSAEFEYLRPLLAYGLAHSADANAKYFERVRLFEIGNVFRAVGGAHREAPHLGVVLHEKGRDAFFELKGIVSHILKGAGLVDLTMKEVAKKDASLFAHGCLELRSDSEVIGYMGLARDGKCFAELDLEKVLTLAEGEREYEPIQKYPSVMRDLSLFVSTDTRIGEVIQAIQEADKKYIFDVDLMDEYVDAKWAGLQSITLRVVFQAKDRTLTSEEVDKMIATITSVLQKKFGAKVR